MLKRIEQRNREVWADHSSILEDVTHVIGGIGVGLLLYPVVSRSAKPLAWAMVLMSTALHFYADTFKPTRRLRPRRTKRAGLAEALRSRFAMR